MDNINYFKSTTVTGGAHSLSLRSGNNLEKRVFALDRLNRRSVVFDNSPSALIHIWSFLSVSLSPAGILKLAALVSAFLFAVFLTFQLLETNMEFDLSSIICEFHFSLIETSRIREVAMFSIVNEASHFLIVVLWWVFVSIKQDKTFLYFATIVNIRNTYKMFRSLRNTSIQQLREVKVWPC